MEIKSVILVFATQKEASACHQTTLNHIPGLNIPIKTIITGMGMINAAIYSTLAIKTYKPSLVISAGIAGSYLGKIPVGKSIIHQEDCFPEMGKSVDEKFMTLDKFLIAENHGLTMPNNSLSSNAFNLQKSDYFTKVKCATVNTMTISRTTAEIYKNSFGASVETMESGAVIAACLANKTPFIGIRTISNLCLAQKFAKWDIDLALKNLNTSLNRLPQLIKSLNEQT